MVDFFIALDKQAEAKLAKLVEPYPHKCRQEDNGKHFYLSSQDAEKVHKALGTIADKVDWGTVGVRSLKDIA